MRKNLAAFFTLLAVCGLFTRRSPAHQWEDSWHEELLFTSAESFPNRALQVEEDRYVYLERGRKDWNSVDRGLIQRGPQGEFLFFSASRGSKAAQFSGKELSGDWGRFILEKQTVPRLKPDSSWLSPNGGFSIGRIEVGMSHGRVRQLYAGEATIAGDTTHFVYGDFPGHCVDVRYDKNDLVARVSGWSMEQGGKPIFNERSRRSDVERTFPGQLWKVVGDREIYMAVPGGTVSIGTGLGRDEVQPGFHCVLEKRSGNGVGLNAQ